MKNGYKKYWQLFWYFRRLQIMRMVEYRANFFFWAFVSTIWGLFNLFFMQLMVRAGGGAMAGWSEQEVYILVGVCTISDALLWSFMYHNMTEYTKHVFRGSLSGLLLKPINTQFVLMTQHNSYTNSFRALLGIAIIASALNAGHISPSALDYLLFGIFFIITNAFLYLFWFILSTFSFWVDRLQNINEIIPNIQRLWRFPSSVYTGLASTLLTVVLPLGLIGTLPAEALVGKLTVPTALYFTAFTIGLFFLGRWFFHISLRRYASVGD